MIRSIVRSVTLGAAALGATLATQAAVATVYTFSFTGADAAATSTISTSSFNSLSYSSGSGSSALSLSVYGAHLTDSTNSAGLNTLAKSSITAETWKGYGLGVLYGSDSPSNGTHQIDNVGGGVDFVVLQFSQAVTLSEIDRVAYDGYDGDASYMAYSGSLSSLLNGVDESDFSSLSYSSSSNYKATTGSTASSTIWLVAASVASKDSCGDAFKLTNLKVTTPSTPAVPEPASWAMMIVGFGAVGSVMRRRKGTNGAFVRA